MRDMYRECIATLEFSEREIQGELERMELNKEMGIKERNLHTALGNVKYALKALREV
jgi:hypothetical protein